jgi:hypothetical protein
MANSSSNSVVPEVANTRASPLIHDLLVGLGAKEIPIYSLETMVGKFGAPGIKAVVEAAQHPWKVLNCPNPARLPPCPQK